MFNLLLLDYVMILDKIYFWKISTEDDIDKINYVGRQLGWAEAQGGTLLFSSYVGSGPASTVHPQKIPGISSTPKKYLKF